MLGRFIGANNPNFGNKYSIESRQKMSDNHVGYKGGDHPQAISIVQLTINDEFICEFPSTREASESTGADRSHISKCCKNKCKTAKGFKWMYKIDYELLSQKIY